jgi:hypothetical protein
MSPKGDIFIKVKTQNAKVQKKSESETLLSAKKRGNFFPLEFCILRSDFCVS